jgi:hypothetical protein
MEHKFKECVHIPGFFKWCSSILKFKKTKYFSQTNYLGGLHCCTNPKQFLIILIRGSAWGNVKTFSWHSFQANHNSFGLCLAIFKVSFFVTTLPQFFWCTTYISSYNCCLWELVKATTWFQGMYSGEL